MAAISISVTKSQLRRFLLKKHGLTGKYKFSGKNGIIQYVQQVGCVQYDPLDICGKNSELVFQSRVENFDKQMLCNLLYTDRQLLDGFDKCLSIYHLNDYPYFERSRKNQINSKSRQETSNAEEVVYEYLKSHEYVCSGDLNLDSKVSWSWSDTRLSRAVLESMYFQGKLAIHHKKGTNKYYCSAENVISSEILNTDDPNREDSDFFKWLVKRRIGSVGVLWNKASDAFLSVKRLNATDRHGAIEKLIEDGTIVRVTVDEIKHDLFCLSADLDLFSGAGLKPRTELLAPLDNMLWDRNLIEAVFDFKYKWEVYNKPEDRKFGYYVLPLLYGEKLIGRAEIINRRSDKTMVVKNLWFEEYIKKSNTMLNEIEKCFNRFMVFNTCDKIDWQIKK